MSHALPNDRYILGVDLGGTNIVVGAMSADGSRQFGMHSIPTRADLGADGVVARIGSTVYDASVVTQLKKMRQRLIDSV